ncbi:hypothetical protein ATI61_105184 [Archangium gephyra]|uniref:Streptomycin adenylyltransferase n=1 Tax=Archangium gephyra TaxID=48 RepID=A0AAC8QG66_9BACT|nr:hypothetical protein [Archangium gephyra]AKJ06850.1 Hypothetical protein AA314_08476 [Archangium gephyra]REG31857.1 hypothetical protein ATI61_105184 [Archangium gephyra]
MELELYRSFTQRLHARLASDSHVLGLIAVGSMAELGRTPDAWSDHDFFVVTVAGVQESFRQDLRWLPDSERIVLKVRETAHGLKVLYDDGHLLEFAIFDEAELHLARVNDYRVLLDRAHVEEDLRHLRTTSSAEAASFDVERAFALFLAALLVGAGRTARGEVLSGSSFIKQHALGLLLRILAHCLPAGSESQLDNLDPFRRFERVFPEQGRTLHHLLLQEPGLCARQLLAFAHEQLAHRMERYPARAVQVLSKQLEQWARAGG